MVRLMMSMPDPDAAALFRAQVLALTELDDDSFGRVDPRELAPIPAYFPRVKLNSSTE